MTESVEESAEITDDRRPYAPAANVVAVLERIRRVNLPVTVDADLFRIAGVSEGAMGRVAYALRFLGLTDTGARPTDRLRAIAGAPEEDWRDLLGGVVREAYASDFARLDPAQDTQPRIVSAFKRYEPRSQTERMVMLFLGLCRAAGMPVLDAPRERQIQAPRPVTGKPTPTRASSPTRTADPFGVSTARGKAAASTPVETLPQTPSNLLFGVTVEDIAELPQADFDAVWAALGKVAQARARATRVAQVGAEQTSAPSEDKTDEK